MPMTHALLRTLAYAWASPTTLVGLGAAALTLLTGGRVRVHTGVLEVWGGFATWALTRLVPLPGGASAMTLGHVVLARDWPSHERTRTHERVHVRQCERWGPLFIPAYFFCSCCYKARGRDAYYDNPFEREAYAVSDGT
ncbi:MAG: hypothetical protein QM770_15285 [Tepidisphaeraceae bacterium]